MDDDGDQRSKQYLTTMLDHAEMLIENIRKEALKMAEDLENVYSSVENVRNSKLLNQLSDGECLIYMYLHSTIHFTITFNIWFQWIEKTLTSLPIVS